MNYTNYTNNTNYTNLLEELKNECKLRGFSSATQKTYSYCIRTYLRFVEQRGLNLDVVSVRSYLLWVAVSVNTARLYHAALSFFFEFVLKTPFSFVEVPMKKRLHQLPKVLSKEQMRTLIASFENVKHRLIVKLLYSSGLRLQELVNLKREDSTVVDGLVSVRCGKGGKDRISIGKRCGERSPCVLFDNFFYFTFRF